MLTRQLPCQLTEAELLQRADGLARLAEQIDELEEEKRSIAADYKSRIDRAKGELASLGKQVREKREWREVEVEREMDYVNNTVSVIRLDTGEVVEERPMDPSERQTELSSALTGLRQVAEGSATISDGIESITIRATTPVPSEDGIVEDEQQ